MKCHKATKFKCYPRILCLAKLSFKHQDVKAMLKQEKSQKINHQFTIFDTTSKLSLRLITTKTLRTGKFQYKWLGGSTPHLVYPTKIQLNRQSTKCFLNNYSYGSSLFPILTHFFSYTERGFWPVSDHFEALTGLFLCQHLITITKHFTWLER